MFVIVEFNQASGQPRLYDTDVHHNEEDANAVAEYARAETAKVGRGETYQVFLLEDVD